jgi:hypothetical protein
MIPDPANSAITLQSGATHSAYCSSISR